MLNMKQLKMAGALALAVALGVPLAACGGQQNADGGIQDTSEGVAATVTIKDKNDQEQTLQIGEKIVTQYIQEFRERSELTDDSAWAQWMADNTLKPSDVRTQVINYYKNELLLDEAARMYDVKVEESEVQEALNEIKGQFESDEAYQEALSATGMTEEEYVEKVLEPNTLQTKLAEAVENEQGGAVDEDAQVLSMAQSMESVLDGSRKSSHILFAADDEKTANDVAKKLKDGSLSWEEAVEQYSTDDYSKANGGDNGWNAVNTFVEAYDNALVQLEKDAISDPVASDYGIHIIKCTDVYTVPEGGITSLDQLPAEIVEALRLQVQNSSSDTFTTWFTEFSESAQLTINDMPEGLPYDVDMSGYEAATQDDTQALEGAEQAPLEGSTEGGDQAAPAEGDQAEGDQAAPAESDQAAEPGATEGATPEGVGEPAEGAGTDGTGDQATGADGTGEPTASAEGGNDTGDQGAGATE